jgi:hypothetical protein
MARLEVSEPVVCTENLNPNILVMKPAKAVAQGGVCTENLIRID